MQLSVVWCCQVSSAKLDKSPYVWLPDRGAKLLPTEIYQTPL